LGGHEGLPPFWENEPQIHLKLLNVQYIFILSRKFLQIFTKKFADPKKNKKGRFLAIRGTFKREKRKSFKAKGLLGVYFLKVLVGATGFEPATPCSRKNLSSSGTFTLTG
jgi:hypothetical protein